MQLLSGKSQVDVSVTLNELKYTVNITPRRLFNFFAVGIPFECLWAVIWSGSFDRTI